MLEYKDVTKCVESFIILRPVEFDMFFRNSSSKFQWKCDHHDGKRKQKNAQSFPRINREKGSYVTTYSTKKYFRYPCRCSLRVLAQHWARTDYKPQ